MNLILPLLITLSLISCSRKAELKSIIPMDDTSVLEHLAEDVGSDVISKKNSFYNLPILKLHEVKSNFLILNSEKKVIRNIPVKFKEISSIRMKLLGLLSNPYSDRLSIDDLTTYKYTMSPDDILQIINDYSFKELEELTLQTSSTFLLEASVDGFMEYLEYDSEILGVENSQMPFTLMNSVEQTNGFEFGVKPREGYVFLSQELSMDKVLKKILIGNEIKFHISNFEYAGQELKDWKENVLEEGSLLVISTEDKDEYSFIRKGETVEQTLKREGKVFDISSDFRMVNFTRMNERIDAGQILALFTPGHDLNLSKRKISETKNVKEYIFTKSKNKDTNIFIQLRGYSHEIKHWYESQRLSSLVDGQYRGYRDCNVSRRKVESSSVDLDVNNELSSYTLFLNGERVSLDELVKENIIRINAQGKTQHISFSNLPGNSDLTEVRLILNSTLSQANIVQDKGQCVLYYRSRRHESDGAFYTRTEEEKFQNFQESSYKADVGIEKMMDLIIIN